MRRNNDLPWINRELKRKYKKDSMITLDLLKIQKTGKHNYKKIKNEIIIDLKQAHDAYCNIITCLMLHILVIANGFGPTYIY